ncbi:PilZ domain-containing protein [Alkalihalobacillus deserti]|uniref:PilZ domain-containing protein n=1 Tax=Alkalihalobacillus deserti TaxID=2879466 RepID=UPI001D158E83|nr:PilZ domain-containing protein [Alkalihalobacillus deserti]
MTSKRYNRNEAFRYEFSKPLVCSLVFTLKSEGQVEKKNRSYTGELINMSPKGVQVYLDTNVLEKEKVRKIELNLTLSEAPLVLKGEVVWKRIYLSGYLYGIQLLEEDMEQIIIEELKIYTKNLKSL